MLRPGGVPTWLFRRTLSDAPKEGKEGKLSALNQALGNRYMNDPVQKKTVEKLADETAKGASFGDALRSGQVAMRSEKMDETWRVTLHRFLEAPTWTFDDFRKTLSDSLDETDNINAAQKAYLQFDKVVRGGDTKDNLEKMKTQLRHQIQLIDKLTPSEKRIPRLLTHEARVMLADELAITKAQVDEVIERYETHHAMHSWIKREHAAGRQLPESYDELMWMMTLRPTRAVSRLQKIQQGRMMPPDAQRRKRLYRRNRIR